MLKNIKLSNLLSRRQKVFNLLVEWTNYCNINCDICPIDAPDMRPFGHMSLELWEKILKDCSENGHYVNWVHHLGEPLLWKHFKEGMKLWRESGLSVRGHISTNGILLNDEKIRIIRDTQIDFIRICIDTLRPEVYKKIRNNDKQAIVIENIKKTIADAKDLNIQLQLMRTGLNKDETPDDFYNYFGRSKNLFVFCTTVMDLGKAYDHKILSGRKLDPRLCNKIEYEHCVIGWDGTVGLCCADYWLKNKLGSIKDLTIAEAFDGKYANEVRRKIRSGDFTLAPACAVCSMDHIRPAERKLIGPFENNTGETS